MYWTNLNDKKIGIWGMGREGKAAKTALENHCSGISLTEISEGNTDDISKCDVLIKSPGVSLYRPEIQNALQQGIVVTSGTNLFLANKMPSTRVIAVTGTKGKSTTASLLAHTLKVLEQRVELGGNIGRPLIELADTDASFVVAELSSYQCADLTGHPDIGVLVNLYPEHLQWHNSHDTYYADKWHMIAQSKSVVLNKKNDKIKSFEIGLTPTWFNDSDTIHMQDNLFYDGNKALFGREALSLIGDHNAENACAVLTVIKLLGLDLMACATAFSSFKPLAHRLQTIACQNGLTYVDDSISTTPETAIAALKALDKGQDITLIAGGLDRGQNYAELVRYLASHKERMRLVTLPDTGRRLAAEAVPNGIEVSPTSDMPTAISIAQHITPSGGTVLLSPAAPSYNLYANFEERGNDFRHWIIETQK